MECGLADFSAQVKYASYEVGRCEHVVYLDLPASGIDRLVRVRMQLL